MNKDQPKCVLDNPVITTIAFVFVVGSTLFRIGTFVYNEATEHRRIAELNASPLVRYIRNSVTADQLYQYCSTNTIRAESSYKKGLVEVSGEIESIGKDILGEPFVTLRTSSGYGYVQCAFSSTSGLHSLNKGDFVTIVGEYDRYLVNVLLKSCYLSYRQ